MIIQKIDGGIGNQLFQYAFGYATSKLNDESFFYETHALHHRKRKWELDSFNISAKELVLPFAKKNKKYLKLIAALQRRFIIKVKMRSNWIIEKEHDYYRYAEKYQKVKSNNYYVGYYQNEKYFRFCKNDILREFSFKEGSIGAACYELGEQLKSLNTCAIHIRKGDYPIEWLVPKEYYTRAINMISNQKTIDKFVVFCENYEYALNIMPQDSKIIYINSLGKFSDIEEFYLISKCKNQIISNSTFSWWAAYLNKELEKCVIAPVTKRFISSFYPDDWHKICFEE